jgi:hypothetical protein
MLFSVKTCQDFGFLVLLGRHYSSAGPKPINFSLTLEAGHHGFGQQQLFQKDTSAAL